MSVSAAPQCRSTTDLFFSARKKIISIQLYEEKSCCLFIVSSEQVCARCALARAVLPCRERARLRSCCGAGASAGRGAPGAAGSAAFLLMPCHGAGRTWLRCFYQLPASWAGGSCSVRNEGEGEQREAARRAMSPAGSVATSMGGGGIAWDTKAHVHLQPWSPGSQTGILLWEVEVCCLFSIIDL